MSDQQDVSCGVGLCTQYIEQACGRGFVDARFPGDRIDRVAQRFGDGDSGGSRAHGWAAQAAVRQRFALCEPFAHGRGVAQAAFVEGTVEIVESGMFPARFGVTQ